MKKMLLATLALLITGCSTDVYCSKQTGSSTKGNHHPSFLRFWNWAETVDAANWQLKMLLKQKPSKHS